jgi:uncharacterized protein
MDIERRQLSRHIEISEGDEGPKISGYAAVFNQLSEDLGGFVEQIEPGAFSEAIPVSDVRALINHDRNMILGRNLAGTLALFEDEQGLGYVIDPPQTSYATDLLASLARGDVSQSSFGFLVGDDYWLPPSTETGGLPVRVITRVSELFDVSPVTFPAYSQTSAAVRERVYHKEWDCCEATEPQSEARGLARHKRQLDLLKLKGFYHV